jgi:hypothetical protein
MIQKRLCGVLAAALLAAAGCDGTGGNGGIYNGGTTTKFTDSKLRGTWESTATSLLFRLAAYRHGHHHNYRLQRVANPAERRG